MLIAIWAQAEDGLIGRQGHLPWRLPADLQFFKQQTLGNTLVMGRKTFEGMGSRPLPGRQTILLTHDQTYQVPHPDVLVMHTADEVRQLAEQMEEPVFIAGGAQIYQLFEPYYDQLLRTVIEGKFAGDAYFPPFDFDDYELISQKEGHVDEKNLYPHRFEKWSRK